MSTMPSFRPALAAIPSLSTAAGSASMQLLRQHVGGSLLPGNEVQLLPDGPAGYEALCRAIAEAEDHINLEGALVTSAAGRPDAGEELALGLLARCRAGVGVNLLYEADGPHALPADLVHELHEAGASVCRLSGSARWPAWLGGPDPSGHAQRRLLVVDGRLGFIGGRRAGHARVPAPLQLRVQGPLVQRLQRLFVSRWQHHGSQAMRAARYYPPLTSVGQQHAALAGPLPGQRRTPFHDALLGAVASSQSQVLLSVGVRPPRELLRALAQAARRGVSVELQWPRGSRWRSLLHHSGVRLHEPAEAPQGMACVLDGMWCGVGAAPVHWPGAGYAAEANLVVLDERFAIELEQVLRDRLAGDGPHAGPAEHRGQRPFTRGWVAAAGRPL